MIANRFSGVSILSVMYDGPSFVGCAPLLSIVNRSLTIPQFSYTEPAAPLLGLPPDPPPKALMVPKNISGLRGTNKTSRMCSISNAFVHGFEEPIPQGTGGAPIPQQATDMLRSQEEFILGKPNWRNKTYDFCLESIFCWE